MILRYETSYAISPYLGWFFVVEEGLKLALDARNLQHVLFWIRKTLRIVSAAIKIEFLIFN